MLERHPHAPSQAAVTATDRYALGAGHGSPYVRRPAGWLRRAPWRLDRLDVEPQPLQEPADESTGCELITDCRVISRNAGPAVDHVAVARDNFRQGFAPLERSAALGEDLDPAAVLDQILGLDNPRLVTENRRRRRARRVAWS